MIFTLTVRLLHTLLKFSQGKFLTALERPQISQEKVLRTLIANLSNTEYGNNFGIKKTDAYKEFCNKMPICTYDELHPHIELEKAGHAKSLLHQKVIFYEKTSGSSGPVKYIPYGKDLKRSFNRMFQYWLYDILENGPHLKTGKSFFSISPSFRTELRTQAGIPLGLDDDTEYLSTFLRLLLKPFWVASTHLKKLKNPDSFKHVLAAQLLSEANLEIISIWNPSFLKIILDYIQANALVLIDDLDREKVTREGFEFSLKPLSQYRKKCLCKTHINWSDIWPNLKFISCWSDTHASAGASELKSLFPKVLVQGKGLLATECPITFPLILSEGSVPLLTEVFFEFEDTARATFQLHEIKVGETYSILISQKGGFYRYRIGDQVLVTHFYKSTPCLKFIGRSDAVADLVGEKLNEVFVSNATASLGSEDGGFKVLLPVSEANSPPYYMLIAEPNTGKTDLITAQLEDYLHSNPHYRNARLLGQLDPLQCLRIENVQRKYSEFFTERGMKWGNIKSQALIHDLEIARSLKDWLTEDSRSQELL